MTLPEKPVVVGKQLIDVVRQGHSHITPEQLADWANALGLLISNLPVSEEGRGPGQRALPPPGAADGGAPGGGDGDGGEGGADRGDPDRPVQERGQRPDLLHPLPVRLLPPRHLRAGGPHRAHPPEGWEGQAHVGPPPVHIGLHRQEPHWGLPAHPETLLVSCSITILIL